MRLSRLTSVFLFASLSPFIWGFIKAKDLIGIPTTASLPSSGSAVSPGADQTKGPLPRIVVWRDGRSDMTTSPDLERDAEKLGYALDIQDRPHDTMSGFVWDAPDENKEPDILATGNWGLISRFRQPTSGNFEEAPAALEVTESLETLRPPRGFPGGPFEFIVPSSRNYQAARALALRYPECSDRTRGPEVPEDLRPVVERLGRAYLEGPEASEAFNDPDRLQTVEVSRNPQAEQVPERSEPENPAAMDDITGAGLARIENPNLLRLQVHQINTCGYWGNEHLAFVLIVSSYESKRMLGWLSVLLVLRNHEGEWRLLTANTRPDRTISLKKIPRLAPLIQNPWAPEDYPAPAKLLAPQDGKAPETPAGEKWGKFEWQPSGSDHVVAQIVEFAYNDDARLFMKFASENQQGQISAGSGGIPWTTRGLCRWRVWSVSDTGAISFSETRSFPNSISSRAHASR